MTENQWKLCLVDGHLKVSINDIKLNHVSSAQVSHSNDGEPATLSITVEASDIEMVGDTAVMALLQPDKMALRNIETAQENYEFLRKEKEKALSRARALEQEYEQKLASLESPGLKGDPQ